MPGAWNVTLPAWGWQKGIGFGGIQVGLGQELFQIFLGDEARGHVHHHGLDELGFSSLFHVAFPERLGRVFSPTWSDKHHFRTLEVQEVGQVPVPLASRHFIHAQGIDGFHPSRAQGTATCLMPSGVRIRGTRAWMCTSSSCCPIRDMYQGSTSPSKCSKKCGNWFFIVLPPLALGPPQPTAALLLYVP